MTCISQLELSLVKNLYDIINAIPIKHDEFLGEYISIAHQVNYILQRKYKFNYKDQYVDHITGEILPHVAEPVSPKVIS